MLNHWDFYLPPIQNANTAYMSCVVSGSKLVSNNMHYCWLLYVRRSAVKIILVPQIKGTTTKDVISFALQNFELNKYLPIYNKLRLPNRSWLCNLGRHLFNYVSSSHNSRIKIQGVDCKKVNKDRNI